MNKLEIMRQTSVATLLEELIKHQPGITSARLWETTKEWYGKLVSSAMGIEFDQALLGLRSEFRCTNKQWYPKGYVGEAKVHGEKKQDERQLRMDW
jgi:hypothetical protein